MIAYRARPAAAGIAALATALAALLLLLAAGVDPLRAATAFARGAFTTRAGCAEALVAATPLLLCGLSVALSFRAGLFNIGAEGQLLCGMLLGAAAGIELGASGPLPALLAGALGGAALAALAAWLRFARGVPEVLATLLLNFVAMHLVGFAVHGFLQEAAGTLPQSDPIAAAARLPRILAPTRLHAGALLACCAALGVYLLLARTRFGLRLRAAGAALQAARVAGFPVVRDQLLAWVLAGALAGLAGAIEVCGVTGRLYEDPSPGFGYLAIAVALLGGLHPAGIVIAALCCGVLEAGGSALERHVGLSDGFTQVLFATAVFVFLAVDSPRFLRAWRARAVEAA